MKTFIRRTFDVAVTGDYKSIFVFHFMSVTIEHARVFILCILMFYCIYIYKKKKKKKKTFRTFGKLLFCRAGKIISEFDDLLCQNVSFYVVYTIL